MSAFADTSAIVKLYVDEAGASVVRRLRGIVAVSALTRVELPAALWRKVRSGELSPGDARPLIGAFESDWMSHRFGVARVTDDLLEDAARLVAVHALRAYDGVQLATAIAVQRAAPEVDTMAAFDDGLRTAAAAEGFALLPS